jgi:hypothetical protein
MIDWYVVLVFLHDLHCAARPVTCLEPPRKVATGVYCRGDTVTGGLCRFHRSAEAERVVLALVGRTQHAAACMSIAIGTCDLSDV